jgi:hypothetical protein
MSCIFYKIFDDDNGKSYQWRDDNENLVYWDIYHILNMTKLFLVENGKHKIYRLPIIIELDEKNLNSSIEKFKNLCLLK